MIRIVLTEDEQLIRAALAGLLGLDEEFSVVGQYLSGEEMIQRAPATDPQVAVVDLQLPGIDGIEACEQLMKACPKVRCMILTSHARPGYLKRALETGISGFMPKTISADELARAVRTLAEGGRVVDSGLAADAIATGDSPLTTREADVLQLVIDGSPVADIAERLHLARGTVRNYLSSAQMKLGADNRHQAAQEARAHGWID